MKRSVRVLKTAPFSTSFFTSVIETLGLGHTFPSAVALSVSRATIANRSMFAVQPPVYRLNSRAAKWLCELRSVSTYQSDASLRCDTVLVKRLAKTLSAVGYLHVESGISRISKTCLGL